MRQKNEKVLFGFNISVCDNGFRFLWTACSGKFGCQRKFRGTWFFRRSYVFGCGIDGNNKLDGNSRGDLLDSSELIGNTASDGDYWLDLTGRHDFIPFGGVQQTINTLSGQSYTLEFDLGSSTQYGPSAITASAGSISETFIITNPSSTDAWDHFAMPFTANSEKTTISLTGIQVTDSQTIYIGLDNVTVTAVPLPPTILLLGASLLRLARYARRRQT